jgi:DNA-binding MarR family transcriptional regulator
MLIRLRLQGDSEMSDAAAVITTAERRLQHIYAELASEAKRAGVMINGAQAFLLLAMEDNTPSQDVIRNGAYVGTNATYLLQRLADLKLIDRKKSDSDQRVIVVRRTAKGMAVAKALQKKLELLVAGETVRRALNVAA